MTILFEGFHQPDLRCVEEILTTGAILNIVHPDQPKQGLSSHVRVSCTPVFLIRRTGTKTSRSFLVSEL